MTTSSAYGTLDMGRLAAPARVKSNPMLSVVIPALNEENGIEDIVMRVQAMKTALQEVGVGGLEVIVVDDGSEDRTAEIVEGLPNTRLLRHAVNQGYGAAIKSGFAAARGELLAFLDADGTYPPEEFPRLCQTLLEKEIDVVVGSRRSGANSQMPAMRRLGNFIWSHLVSSLGSQRVIDPASGMRVVQRDILPRLYPLPDGLNFTPVMSTRSVHEKLKVVEIPIPYAERVGASKLTIVGDGTRFLTTILWTGLQYNPVRLLGAIGIGSLSISALIGIGLLTLRFQGVTDLGPWGVFSLFAALVLGVAGVSITSLGVTFSYLVALFHHQPTPRPLMVDPFFRQPLNHHFGWIGLAALLGGSVIGISSFLLSIDGWPIARLWFWLLSSALLVLMGLQLAVSWIVMRILELLSDRESHIQADLQASG